MFVVTETVTGCPEMRTVIPDANQRPEAAVTVCPETRTTVPDRFACVGMPERTTLVPDILAVEAALRVTNPDITNTLPELILTEPIETVVVTFCPEMLTTMPEANQTPD